MKNNLICKVCKKNDATISHHICYKEDITIPVCYYCHRLIHKNEKHEYYPIDRPFMRSIGISDEVYELLLHVKHDMEKNKKEVMSFDKIIHKLIYVIGGEMDAKEEKDEKEESS